MGQKPDSVLLRQLDSLITISRKCTSERNFEQAIQIGETAQKIALEAFGSASAPYANCLFNLGRVYHLSERYEKAEPYYLQANAVREIVLSPEHRDFARGLINLALLYSDMGQYELAEPIFVRAKNLQGASLGLWDIDYAKTLNNLAVLYQRIGRYESAESLYRDVMAIREKELGREHPDYFRGLNNLAILYYSMGRYSLAEQLYLEAKDYWENQPQGAEHPSYLVCLSNLAILYYNMDRYELAEPLFLKAKALREKKMDSEQRDYARLLNDLALLYSEMDRYELAESYFQDSKTILEKILGKEHPEYAETLNNLAGLYHRTGRYELAAQHYREAITIREKVLGRTHPDFAVSVNNLAHLLTQSGRYKSAEPFYQEAGTIALTLLRNASRYLSVGELSAYLQLFVNDLDRYYTFTQITQAVPGNFSAACYDNALFHKGFLLNVSSRINNLAASDTAAIRLNNLVKSYHRRLAVQYAKPIHQRLEVEELEAKTNAAEKELARSVAGFGEAIRQVHWQDVQATLLPGEAAIEFIHYRYCHALRPSDSIMYAALVQRHGDAYPQMVPLFEERQLARLLPAIHDMDRIDAFYKLPVGQTVYDLVWQPLARLLEGVSTVYCAPSGLLHRLNLGAVPVHPDQVIADRYQLVLLGSTRQLVGRTGSGSSTNTAVLFGGIQYDSDSTSGMPALPDMNRGLEQDTAILIPGFTTLVATSPGGPKPWKFLPATATEVNNIGAMLSNHGFGIQLRTGSIASEEVFKQLGRSEPAPRILHLATHGYFFSDTETSPKQNPRSIGEQDLVFRASDNPMIRSGLILASANQTWTSCQPPALGEDGILTAYEISQQDLSNTELIVLSACETGLGQIQGNEGVYGLQRAFKIAGVRYLIMSLWQVNDQKTGELMIEFYRNYLDGKLPVPEAFRAAQRTMRTRYPGSPYVWAGFILVE